MGTPGPQKINRYGIAFKLKAVQMSNQPGVLIKDVAESLCIHPFMLSPRTDAQRWLQSRALSLSGDIAQTRCLLIAQADSSIPPVLLAVLIFWIAIIFLSFGLFAPRNATVLAALLVCALSVSGSIFLLLELNGPFNGAIRISSSPMREALAHLGR
jgi:hypothetical protein